MNVYCISGCWDEEGINHYRAYDIIAESEESAWSVLSEKRDIDKNRLTCTRYNDEHIIIVCEERHHYYCESCVKEIKATNRKFASAPERRGVCERCGKKCFLHLLMFDDECKTMSHAAKEWGNIRSNCILTANEMWST